MGRLSDYIGKKFGKLTVIDRNYEYSKENNLKNHSAYWNCICDCGNNCIVSSQTLKKGKFLSCGCERRKDYGKNKINKVGKRYGSLVVLKEIEQDSKGRIRYLCRCDCGKEKIMLSSYLYESGTFSCGCAKGKSNVIDISGQRFGKITVIKYLNRSKKIEKNNYGSLFLCKCDCGTEFECTYNQLVYGDVQSCGCLLSKGEEKIAQILTKNNIKFIKQYTFKDLVSPNNICLRFDFYLPEKNVLIEYDGAQHYTKMNKQTQEDFEQGLFYDNLKNEYCKNNNIPLIRIPYWNYNKLTIDYINKLLENY